jgi:hypothetical protein
VDGKSPVGRDSEQVRAVLRANNRSTIQSHQDGFR